MQPNIYSVDEHEIDPDLIDPDALAVLNRLHHAGYVAYLVGGGVRDLLLKKIPKDFDISTSARPEEIKDLFRRQCILIGRRFRLAHIRFGHKIIEVSTFRAGDTLEESLIISDNKWGTPEEDVLRRDFTINGLYYDPTSHSVIDYVGGWEDIHQKVLRSIGDPVLRFKQDPVRMIRLLKFRSRFDLPIDPETEKGLEICRSEIIKSSPARVQEEVLRMLESSCAEPFFDLLQKKNFLKILFPVLHAFLETPHGNKLFHYLHVADKLHRHKGKKVLDRATLIASLVFPILERKIAQSMQEQEKSLHLGDIMTLSSSIVRQLVQTSFPHFPRRLSSVASYILTMQYRLTPLSGKRHPRPKMMRNHEFVYAMQLLKLRALVNENCVEPYQTWKHFYKQVAGHAPPSLEISPTRPKRSRKRSSHVSRS